MMYYMNIEGIYQFILSLLQNQRNNSISEFEDPIIKMKSISQDDCLSNYIDIAKIQKLADFVNILWLK